MALGGLTYQLYLLHQHMGFIAFNGLGQHLPAEILVPATAIVMIDSALAMSRHAEPRGRGRKRHAAVARGGLSLAKR
jgi:peptidoglycan/LPS O-acetylase OafA/YrhL